MSTSGGVPGYGRLHADTACALRLRCLRAVRERGIPYARNNPGVCERLTLISAREPLGTSRFLCTNRGGERCVPRVWLSPYKQEVGVDPVTAHLVTRPFACTSLSRKA